MANAAKESESRANYIADRAGTFNSNVPNLQVVGIAVIEAATEGFSIENKLGDGGYGPVYKVNFYNGEYHGTSLSPLNMLTMSVYITC